MELNDEYLAAFCSDMKSIAMTASSAVQFVLGLSYLAGKYLTETIVSACSFIVFCSVEFKTFLESLVGAIVDIWISALHGILLTYYGIGKIIEAFQITFMDLISLIVNIYNSFGQLLASIVGFITSSLWFLTIIPSQLNTTLGLIGDLFITLVLQVGNLLQHFVTTLIWSPFYALSVLCYWIWVLCIQLPTEVIKMSIDKITSSGLIGFCVLVLCIYAYSRISFSNVFLIVGLYALNGSRRAAAILLAMCRKIKRKPEQGQRIQNVNNNTSSDNGTGDENCKGLCVVCQASPVSYISSPCNHVCLCHDCVHQLVEYDNRCPMCRKEVQYFSRVYIS